MVVSRVRHCPMPPALLSQCGPPSPNHALSHGLRGKASSREQVLRGFYELYGVRSTE